VWEKGGLNHSGEWRVSYGMHRVGISNVVLHDVLAKESVLKIGDFVYRKFVKKKIHLITI
jgi:hypothetical protein